MKKLKFLIAAVFALCVAQGAWAIAPGGALGGGGKAAQAHPQQEGTLAAPPSEAAGPATDIQSMESSKHAPVVDINTTDPKSTIGSKPATEGQASSDVDESSFKEASVKHAKTKEVRQQLKEAIKKHRQAVKDNAPDSPLDDQLILYVILAILIPPLAVALYMNGITTEFWICLLLTLLFYLPGQIYALWVILR